MNKKRALINYLNIQEKVYPKTTDISVSCYDNSLFEYGSRDYLVLTDKEADEKAKEYILDTAWAFNTWFLASYMPEGVTEEVLKAIQEKCESGNEAILAMIKDKDGFVDDAILADGRGHFISFYDGNEYDVGDYFIYRIN